MEELQVNMKNRLETSRILRDLKMSNLECKYQAEELAAEQNFEVRLLPYFNGIDTSKFTGRSRLN